jgi:hypothetical protein
MFKPKLGWGATLGVTAAALAAWSAQAAGGLAVPFRVEAEGKPIDMQYGEAAPAVCDFDGDGTFDLLVGQRSECKLKIFRNQGSNAKPQFGVSAWFQAGGVEASLPGG